ncbi:hypothetical protein RHMOL_Rhmol06G0158800 [Rhododendron molle]|uniref:Uncharacterized protein n=1 Tax=Rhododendron molle TaxID=49168 RepID=A0ACC0NDL6_RHOML|nr:hypothetical protein RHMOL_Rhmol06G0158800 [Rhododendron molle]
MHNRLRDLSAHKKAANHYHCIPLCSSSTNSQYWEPTKNKVLVPLGTTNPLDIAAIPSYLNHSLNQIQIPDFCVELGVEVAPWESNLGIGVVGIVALPLPLALAHDAAEELDG